MYAEVLKASNPDGSLKYEQYQLRTKELLAKKTKKLRGCWFVYMLHVAHVILYSSVDLGTDKKRIKIIIHKVDIKI